MKQKIYVGIRRIIACGRIRTAYRISSEELKESDRYVNVRVKIG
jgi:hypothetical protein